MMAFNDMPSDSETIARFYEAHKKALLNYARAILRDDELAADALQNAIESLLHSYDHVRDLSDADLLHYSMKVVRRECYRIFKKQNKMPAPSAEIEELAQDSADLDEYIQFQDREVMQKAVSQLKRNYRTAIELRYYQNRDDAAIAFALDIKPESVRAVLSRARNKLKELYLAEEVDRHGQTDRPGL